MKLKYKNEKYKPGTLLLYTHGDGNHEMRIILSYFEENDTEYVSYYLNYSNNYNVVYYETVHFFCYDNVEVLHEI